MNRSSLLIVFLSLAIFYSCANQVSPTGGPKDERPPILLSSTPEQGQLNFEGKEIILSFDELIRTDNPKEQFIITPRTNKDYEVKHRKNKVIIEFKEPLKDSTTYSINFREGIKDLTEGNAADTLRLAFSTGSYLDSLSIEGNVTDLLSNQPAKDIMVALYTANDTLNIFNSPPLYFTKTYSDGSYSFENIKHGKYSIYAVADKNKNLTLESKSEKHGFRQTILHLDSSLSNIDIPIQFLDVRDLALQSHRQSGTNFNIKFNKYIIDYKIEPVDSLKALYSNFTDDTRTTLQLFKPFNYQDSIQLFIKASDSVDYVIQDTLYAKFEPTQREPGKFTSKALLKKINTKNPVFNTVITFNKPIHAVNYDSIYVHLDSANIILITSEMMSWNYSKDKLEIAHPLDASLFVIPTETATTTTSQPSPDSETESRPARNGKAKGDRKDINRDLNVEENTNKEESPQTESDPYKPLPPHLYIGKAAFISAELDSSKRDQQNLLFVKPEQLGIILVEVKTEHENYFVQLIKGKEVVMEEENGTTFSFSGVEPGEYRIRILVDDNKNGEWDPGNVKNQIEPESVIFYQRSEGNEVITVRANWEVGPHVISF